MERIERRVVMIGTSFYINIPSKLVKMSGIAKDEYLYVKFGVDRNGEKCFVYYLEDKEEELEEI